MKRSTYKFVYNHRKKLVKGVSLVQLRVTKNRKIKYISTDIYIKPEEWDDSKQCIVKHKKRIEYNRTLRQLRNKIEDAEFRMDALGQNFEVNCIDEILSERSPDSFTDFFQKEIDKEKKVWNTVKTYITTLNSLKDFGKIQYFSDLTTNNINEFDIYLKGKYAPSTVHKRHSVLKSFINRAVIANKLPKTESPYNVFKIESPPETSRKYLTAEELARIEEKEFSIGRIKTIKDLFLFQCYTGLSFAELEIFTKEMVVEEDGVKFIDASRVKTGSDFVVPLIPKALEILERYDYKLPVKTNQRMNTYLKEIADLCEITKNLTTHVARHTFATTITLTQGVPIETVSKMLGHKSLNTTRIYAKLLKKRIANDMKDLL